MTLEDVHMSEKEKINEMDAAEMLAGYRAENPVDAVEMLKGYRAEKDKKAPAADLTEREILKMIRDFDADVRRWNRRQGWEAFGLCLVSCLVVMACCAAMLGGPWKLVIAGIDAAHLMLAGAWLQKAKAGWSA